jgi:hypothetical protein
MTLQSKDTLLIKLSNLVNVRIKRVLENCILKSRTGWLGLKYTHRHVYKLWFENLEGNKHTAEIGSNLHCNGSVTL